MRSRRRCGCSEQHGGEVVVCTAGPARAGQVLREALARGADRAIHVEDDLSVSADAFVSPSALAAAISDEHVRPRPDRAAVRRSGARRRPASSSPSASACRTPRSSWRCRSTDGRRLRVKRELEGGWFQWIAMPLPALLTIQSGINQLRYATLKGIMAAKKKEIRKVALRAVPAPKLAMLASPCRRRPNRRNHRGAPAEAAGSWSASCANDARVLG